MSPPRWFNQMAAHEISFEDYSDEDWALLDWCLGEGHNTCCQSQKNDNADMCSGESVGDLKVGFGVDPLRGRGLHALEDMSEGDVAFELKWGKVLSAHAAESALQKHERMKVGFIPHGWEAFKQLVDAEFSSLTAWSLSTSLTVTCCLLSVHLYLQQR